MFLDPVIILEWPCLRFWIGVWPTGVYHRCCECHWHVGRLCKRWRDSLAASRFTSDDKILLQVSKYYQKSIKDEIILLLEATAIRSEMKEEMKRGVGRSLRTLGCVPKLLRFIFLMLWGVILNGSSAPVPQAKKMASSLSQPRWCNCFETRRPSESITARHWRPGDLQHPWGADRSYRIYRWGWDSVNHMTPGPVVETRNAPAAV